MDRRIAYKMILDCETCPCDKDFNGVSPFNMLVYDLGWVVADKRGKIYRTRSFVNKDIFLGEKDLMQSAYYAEKIPQYIEDLKNGSRTLATLYEIRKCLCEDLMEFGIKQIWAHNMFFDLNALNNTQRWETKSKYRYFFPYGIEICDILKIARQLIATMPSYKRYCENNGYLTKRNQPRLTAEIIYRFISGDENFKEEHKGLQDCLIEKEILKYCYNKHKSMNGKLY